MAVRLMIGRSCCKSESYILRHNGCPRKRPPIYVTSVIRLCAHGTGWECAGRADCAWLPVMLPFTTVSRRRSLAGRLHGSAGLLLFLVAVVIVPLWPALSFCSMPCCHHSSSSMASATSQDPCCAISRGDTAAEAVAASPADTPQRSLATAEPAAALTVAFAPDKPAAAALATHVPRPPDSPIHILNSVFLI